MKGYPNKRARRQSGPVDPVSALRDYAIKLHDKGDGRGVDWAKVAETVFKVAFSCLDELPPGNERAQTVVRRVHDGSYNRLAGTPDSGTPYTADQPERPPFSPDAGLRPDLDLHPGAPSR